MNLLSDLKEKRLIIITGKGGVGKTTLSAAMALALSKINKKVLVCEINANQKIPGFFNQENHGGTIKEIAKNIFSVNILPKEAMREYGIMILKSKILYKTIFENKFVSKFLNGFPGLNELLTLGKIRYHEKELDDQKNPLYDTIIVDAPATGHGLSLLKFPITILRVLTKGPLAEEEKKLYSLLTDKERTSIQVVTLPEELPVKESLELQNTIKNDLKMPFGFFFFNAMIEPIFTKSEKDFLEKTNLSENILSGIRFRYSRSELHKKYYKIIETKYPAHTLQLPFVFSESFSFSEIEKISNVIGDFF